MRPSPNERIPGCVDHPTRPSLSGSATDCAEVCRPFPTPETTPVARSASGTRRFTNVDLPTPECPSSTVILLGQQGSDDVERGSSRPAMAMVKSETAELFGERFRRGQVGLGQAQDRCQPTGVRGDQRPVDESGAWRRVGQCHHDQQLVGVGDHHPFGGVGVIGGAPQHRSPRSAPHDAGQGVVATGQIADDVDIVADDDRRAAQFPRPHGGDAVHRVAVEHTSPAAAVDADHHGRLRRRRARAGSLFAVVNPAPNGL